MDDLRGKATKAFLWDLLGSYGAQIISFIISIFLARLLSPEDFGLVGMSMVFIGMLQVFKDMGFTSALIQNDNNTSITYSSIFYLNLFAGAVLTLLLFFLAPFIGEFYDSDIITKLVRLLSITFFISSFNMVQSTIFSKKLDLKRLTLRNLVSQVSAGLIAIVFAFYDYGVYALVIQQIVSTFLGSILLWQISSWYPRLEFSWREVKKLSGFSFYVFAASAFNRILQRVDALVIGKLFSASILGYFSRANSLNNLIAQHSSGSLLKVFFPTLSQLRGQPERFDRTYLKVVRITATVAIFLTGISFLIGEELIIGLFGPKWESSIPIFKILILKGFTYPISAMIVNAFLAKGLSKENFHYGNIRKGLRFIPFIIAFFWGFYPFLYASVGVSLFGWVLNNYFVSRSLGVSLRNQIFAVLPQLLVTVLIISLIEFFSSNEFSYILTIIKSIIYMLFYFLFLKLSKSPIFDEFSLIKANLLNFKSDSKKNNK